MSPPRECGSTERVSEPWDTPAANAQGQGGKGDREQPGNYAGGRPREGHLKCLKSLSRSFRKGGRKLTLKARKQTRVVPLLFLPLLQEEAIAEQEKTGGEEKETRQRRQRARGTGVRGLWARGDSD